MFTVTEFCKEYLAVIKEYGGKVLLCVGVTVAWAAILLAGVAGIGFAFNPTPFGVPVLIIFIIAYVCFVIGFIATISNLSEKDYY